MIKVAIVEDEECQAEELRAYLVKYFSERNVPTEIDLFSDADAFLATFAKHKYAIIFMDIEMPGTSGMQASKILRSQDEDVLLFFVTNLAQYALESYNVSAFDYVVKPVNYHNLALKLKRAMRLLRNSANITININTVNGVRIVAVSNIRFIEVMGHSLTYHTTSGDLFVGYDSLKAVREKLEPYDFVLCDRSFLVNLKYVTGIDGANLYVGNDVLKIAKSRRAEFMSAFVKYFANEDEK